MMKKREKRGYKMKDKRENKKNLLNSKRDSIYKTWISKRR